MAKSKSIRLPNPATYFSNWSYRVERYHWEAFSINMREFVDKERTKIKRENAEPGETVSPVKISEWAISTPTVYGFHSGDVFKHASSADLVQVVHVAELLEVHHLPPQCSNPDKPRRAYSLSPEDFAAWLKTGTPPRGNRISPDLSRSETFRYSISDPAEDFEDLVSRKESNERTQTTA